MSFQDKTENRYRAQGGRVYHDTKRAIPEAAYVWVARLRAAKIAPYVAPWDTVFEYGVGTGWNLAALECARKVGCDLAENLEPQVREHGIEFVAHPDALAPGSVDVAICHHVLEHTSDPPEILQQCKALLKPAGRLLVFVPFEKERRYRRYNCAEPNHHVYSWNVQTMGNLVTDCGFQIDTAGIGRFGYARFAAVWATRLGMGERTFRLIRRLVHLAAPMLEVRVVAQKSPEPNS